MFLYCANCAKVISFMIISFMTIRSCDGPSRLVLREVPLYYSHYVNNVFKKQSQILKKKTKRQQNICRCNNKSHSQNDSNGYSSRGAQKEQKQEAEENGVGSSRSPGALWGFAVLQNTSLKDKSDSSLTQICTQVYHKTLKTQWVWSNTRVYTASTSIVTYAKNTELLFVCSRLVGNDTQIKSLFFYWLYPWQEVKQKNITSHPPHPIPIL